MTNPSHPALPDRGGRRRDEAETFERDYVPGVFAPWARAVADAAGVAPGHCVLDVGCGTGALSREAARRAGAPERVTGVDLDGEMLAVARRITPAITWLRGDALDLPFPGGRFDAVLSQFAMMFFDDRERGVREMWRVLAPGGHLTVAVWGRLDHAPFHETFVRIAQRRAGDAAAGRIRERFSLGDAAELARIFERAGVPAEMQTRAGSGSYARIEAFGSSDIDGWIRKGEMPPEERDAVLAELRDAAAPFIDAQGALTFPLEGHIVTACKDEAGPS